MRLTLTKPAVMLLMLAALLLVLAGCGSRNNTAGDGSSASNGGSSAPSNTTDTDSAVGTDTVDTSGSKPVVTIEMDSGKTITVELYPKVAPNTVNNFVSLVKKGFYDGLGFHRVMPGFMIQGGDPEGTGAGGPGYDIAGEFSDNGFQNNLKHTRGVLSMARSKEPDTAGSQFFIMVADAPHLDGLYTAFGKVTAGMDVVDEIVNVPTDGETPKTMPVMKKVTVDTLGTDYPEPATK
jgi:peptidyl-prolyl cis-trans isomerase B (cyclophilin B)